MDKNKVKWTAEPTEQERVALELVDEGRVDAGVRILEKEAERRRKQGDVIGSAWDWFTIGGLLRPDSKKQENAAKAYENAGTLFHKVGERKGLMMSLLRFAQVRLRQGELDEVVEPARMAMDMAGEDGDQEMFLDAFMTVWSGMHATKDPNLAEFLEQVSHNPVIADNPTVRERFELFTRDIEDVDKDMEARLLASGDTGLLAHFYSRKGSAELTKGNVDAAIEFMTLGKHAAVQSQDVLAYFLNVLGLVMAYELKDDKINAMQALLLGAASIRSALGDSLDQYFYMVFNSLRQIWGEEAFRKIMDKLTDLLGLSGV